SESTFLALASVISTGLTVWATGRSGSSMTFGARSRPAWRGSASPVAVIEKILAHRSGTFRGVVGVYQKHSFLPAMASAVQKWADHVAQVVDGRAAKVVKLRRR